MARLVGIALIAVALPLTACGGGDDEPEGGSRAATAGDSSTGGAATPDSTETREGEKPPAPSGEGGRSKAGETKAGEPAQDGDAPPASQGEGVSRQAYIARADPLCTAARAQIGRRGRAIQQALLAVANGEMSKRAYSRRAAKLTLESARIADRTVARLQRLPRPRARRRALESYLAGATGQAQILELQARALRRNDEEAVVTANQRLGRNGRTLQRAARRFGFRSCGGAQADA